MIEALLREFQAAMQATGLVCAQPLVADGKIHRFKTADDTRPNSWYVFFPENRPAGAFGCWKRGIKEEWSAMPFKKTSIYHKRTALLNKDPVKQAFNSVQDKTYQETSKRANRIWGESLPVTLGNHPYLLKKQIKPYQVKCLKDVLIIPLIDEQHTIWSLQFISPDGSKRFLKSGRKKGLFYTLGEKSTDTLYICEGYATACTIHEVSRMQTVIAFDAHNLLPVAKLLRTRYPDKKIILCADNDQFTDSNPGLIQAQAAACAVDARVVFPVFSSLATKPTDFNDLYQLEGIDTVKKQLSLVQPPHSTLTLSNFIVNHQGVFYAPSEDSEPLKICSRLDIIARTRDEHSLSHGRLLEFVDPDNKKHQWAMPMEMLAGDGTEYRRILLSRGLEIASSRRAREQLTHYILTHCPDKVLLCVTQTGWHKKTFVLPDRSIGSSPDTILLQTAEPGIDYSTATAGTLAEWQNHVATYCQHNSRLLFALGAAFASVLLYLLPEESGGFHFLGASSIGKTTLLHVASSVWGGPERLQRWRATSNGLEAIAALHNDSLLCLDEMGQVDPKEIGEMAYMLANGSGKGRCFRDGSVRKKSTWRLLFLSTGETGLSDHIIQGGKKMKAGQAVRLVDIPADAGSNLGIYESLHQFESGTMLSRHLNKVTMKYYGTPIRQYLSHIIQDFDATQKFLQQVCAEFLKTNTTASTDGQVYRVASRFALIAAAGELASEVGITPWQKGAALQGVSKCFHDWIIQRGGTGPKESLLALAQVRYFFEAHGESRFSPWDTPNREQKTFNRAGFRRGSDFFVFQEVFKQDICAGLNSKFVAKLCLDRGWLVSDSNGHALTSHRLPDTGKTRRVYQFCDKLFNDEFI